MRLTVRLAKFVTTAPASPTRIPPTGQSVVDEPQERRRVSFHDECVSRIPLPYRPLAADINIEPFVSDSCEIRAITVVVVNVAADARPRGVGVLFGIWRRWTDNIEEVGKFSSDPRAS